MGELTFFLGLQVQQRPDGIFINQDKYLLKILKKFDLECVRTATTPYEAPKPKNRLTKPKSILKELDLDADDKTFIKFVSDEDSTDEAPILWSALVGWEVISTPLGEINALYRSDQSTKHFTTLREILHLVLIDSQEGGKGSFVWNNQHLWQIKSWRLYTLSNVHVLETVSREVLYMFAYVSYPLSVKLMERMLKHKMEIDKDVVGNDMTN
ncbi:hypothetical protein Tco_1064067, partial [Tanacetum coccineum]